MSHDASEHVENITGDDPDLDRPIPVEVANAVRVQEFPARTINSGAVTLPADQRQVVRVVSALRSRSRVMLRADGGACYVGGHAGITPGTGFYVSDGQTITLEHSGDVFALSDGAESRIYWLTENRDG